VRARSVAIVCPLRDRAFVVAWTIEQRLCARMAASQFARRRHRAVTLAALNSRHRVPRKRCADRGAQLAASRSIAGAAAIAYTP
jgi:hypothetical protein